MSSEPKVNRVMPKPNFFIVGAPKCGTTAMYEYLRVHPEVYLPQDKEPHYFASDFKAPRFERFRGNEGKYLALFSGAGRKWRIGEASVFYLYSKQAAEEIKQFNPEAKIIAMLRSPVDAMYALYHDHVFNSNENLLTFEEALAAEADRKLGKRIPGDLYIMPEALCYREIVRYTVQVKRYFDIFGRDPVQVIIFDDLQQNTPQVYKSTLAFLGVDPGFQPDFKIVNSSRRIRSRAVLRLLRIRWLIALGEKVPALAYPVNNWIREMNTRRASRSPMDSDLRSRLRKEFLPEVEQLSKLLDRDLTPWCRD